MARAPAHRIRHGEALEKGLQGHLLVDLGEEVLVTSERVSSLHRRIASSRSSGLSERIGREPCLEPARVKTGRRHSGFAHERRVEGYRRRDAADLKLAERAIEAGKCRRARLVPGDQLAEKRI